MSDYRFIDKDPIIDVIRTAIQATGAKIRQLSNNSGVAEITIRNWLEGDTRRPQRLTSEFVLRALGVETTYVWQDSGTQLGNRDIYASAIKITRNGLMKLHEEDPKKHPKPVKYTWTKKNLLAKANGHQVAAE